MLRLPYNRYDICKKNPNSEIQYELSGDCESSIKIKFKTFDLPGFEENGFDFEDIVKVRLFSEKSASKKSKNGFEQITLFCEITGLLVDDEIFARKFTEEILEKICKRLSILFIKHNSERYRFQPRVEPLWSKAVFKCCEYQKYVNKKVKLHEKTDDKITTIRVDDNVSIRDKCFMQSNISLCEKDIDVYAWLFSKNSTAVFLLNEYYNALGTENIKSKFFHLFAMIEFCERQYEKYNGFARLVTDGEANNIISIVEENIQLDKDKKNRILSLIASDLKRANDIGRTGKLLNILKWMGIDRYNKHLASSTIDKISLDRIITLRNKSFHGTEENLEETENEYYDAVEKLFYINEQILDYVMNSEKMAAKDKDSNIIILGKL